MQNNRKKIIFLDGNYSGGGEEGNPQAAALSEQTAVEPGAQGAQAGVAVPVAAPGAAAVRAEQTVVTTDAERALTDAEGQVVDKEGKGSESDGEEDAASGPGAGTAVVSDEEEVAPTVVSEVASQQVGSGDYDYDLLSEGGRSSIDSASVVSSVGTADLLSVDPLYIRLTKFLETSNKMEGGSTANIADLLYEVSSSLKSIKTSFQDINSTLKKLAVTKASQ